MQKIIKVRAASFWSGIKSDFFELPKKCSTRKLFILSYLTSIDIVMGTLDVNYLTGIGM